MAEFATVLGDYKLATYVWETLRKDGKGGSDILPLLLAPAPGVQLHAQLALQSLSPVQQQSGGTLPHVLWNALRYVARWEEGIPMEDFMGEMLEGDRWLVWAAGNVSAWYCIEGLSCLPVVIRRKILLRLCYLLRQLI